MKQAYKKRSPRATANSPPVLPDMGELFYKSGNFIMLLHIHSLTQSMIFYFFKTLRKSIVWYVFQHSSYFLYVFNRFLIIN